jgi:hypothetical protein
MPNQKISELTAIVTVDNSVDVLPIVDISANTTKKVTPNALKTALALDNVNNTSDANKPVSIAQQDALNAKVDENAPITAGTAPKITFDAKGLVTSGDSLDETDLPTGINANKIGTGAVSSTEFGYLDGVTSAIQTQINSKQATLVSGTNIKTINSTSLLGAGDISISASPSGVSGAIQFSNGSAFASDAANLFWDDTNNRLGVGTNAPSSTVDINSNTLSNAMFSVGPSFATGFQIFNTNNTATPVYGIGLNASYINTRIGFFDTITFRANGTGIAEMTSSEFRVGSISGARVGIKGSGSTSATTSLLVQNSASTSMFQVRDDGNISIFTGRIFDGVNTEKSFYISGNDNIVSNYRAVSLRVFDGTAYASGLEVVGNGAESRVGIGTTAPNASAKLQVDSTTKGFLPPRGTNTQMNAIASPATGLVFYDTTNNKLCVYNATSWIPLH